MEATGTEITEVTGTEITEATETETTEAAGDGGDGGNRVYRRSRETEDERSGAAARTAWRLASPAVGRTKPLGIETREAGCV